MYKEIPKAPDLEINVEGAVRRVKGGSAIFPDKNGMFTFPTSEGQKTLFNVCELVEELFNVQIEPPSTPLSGVSPIAKEGKPSLASEPLRAQPKPEKKTKEKKGAKVKEEKAIKEKPAKKEKVAKEKKEKKEKTVNPRKECRTLEQLPAKAKELIKDKEISQSDKARGLVKAGMTHYEIKKLTGIRRTLIRAALKKNASNDK